MGHLFKLLTRLFDPEYKPHRVLWLEHGQLRSRRFGTRYEAMHAIEHSHRYGLNTVYHLERRGEIVASFELKGSRRGR